MIQRYKIILWKKPEDSDREFDDIARETYNTLLVFQKFPKYLRPNYLTSETKNNALVSYWEYEDFKNTLKHNVNKEGNIVFEELGYRISYFSDMDDEKSCGISLKVGNKDQRFVNTLIVDLPIFLDLKNNNNIEIIKLLFRMLVLEFKPNWGCVLNRALTRKYGKYVKDGLPSTIHWINYWSEEIINRFGADRLENFINDSITVSQIDKGVFSISEKALLSDVEDDVVLQDKLHNKLFCSNE